MSYLASESPFDLSPNRQKTRTYDALRALELKELQEEERYINELRLQRERIESLRNEMIRKEALIQSLEQELGRLRASELDTKRLQGQLNQLQASMKLKDEEVSHLKNSLRVKVQEYSSALLETKQSVTKENERALKETRNLQVLLCERDQEIAHLQEELSRFKSVSFGSDDKLKNLERKLKSVELGRSEDRKQWSALEQVLKDQVAELAHEKQVAEAAVAEKENELQTLSGRLSRLGEIETILRLSRKETADLQARMRSSEQESQQRLEEALNEASVHEQRCRSLENDLKMAEELIERQESILAELRHFHQDHDIRNIRTLSESERRNKELEVLTRKYQISLDEQSRLSQRLVELEGSYAGLMQENTELRHQVQTITSQEAREQGERREWARVKMDLIQKRNAEISRLTDTIEAFQQT